MPVYRRSHISGPGALIPRLASQTCNWQAGCTQQHDLRNGRCMQHRCYLHIYNGVRCDQAREARSHYCGTHRGLPAHHSCSIPACGGLTPHRGSYCHVHNTCVADRCGEQPAGGVGSACRVHRCVNGCSAAKAPNSQYCSTCDRANNSRPNARRNGNPLGRLL